MKRTLPVLSWMTLAVGTQPAQAQQGIPIVTLPASTTKSAESLGGVAGLRPGPGGTVLVNDAARRQLRLFDENLTASTIVADSAAGSANSYGPIRSRLIPWTGDSSLFLDANSQTLLVLDARGRVGRAMALPFAQNFGAIMMLTTGGTSTDHKGRLVYRGMLAPDADSVPILRADFGTRAVDTLGRMRVTTRGRQTFDTSVPGQLRGTVTIDPLPMIDEWAVLSDGTIALVRGHDYHIDWIHPDGTRTSSSKLPFDWKRLTDTDKQKAVDSARAANDAVAASLRSGAFGGIATGGGGGGGGAAGGGRGGGGGGGSGGGDPAPPSAMQVTTKFLPLNEITDYYPPIRQSAAMADLDGNLWILPTTSAQSQQGELVYDVVSVARGLYERVRLPPGRSIVGFAKGGVVYLVSGDRTNGFFLERTRLP